MSWNNLNKWLQIAPDLPDVALKAYHGMGDIRYDHSGRYPVVYPPRSLVFAALESIAPEDVRVVILGQDPYHSPGKARGVAFGYHPEYKGSVNSSMANILDEASRGHTHGEFDLTLQHWVDQGVLLLNTRLTVEHEKPMSHAGLGWEPEVQKLIDYLIAVARKPMVFLCWGAEARKMVMRQKTIDNPNVLRLCTSHPCKYSASRGSFLAEPFLGSRCFDKANKWLITAGEEPIKWL